MRRDADSCIAPLMRQLQTMTCMRAVVMQHITHPPFRGMASIAGEDMHGGSTYSVGRIRASRMHCEEYVAQNLGMIVDPTFRMWNQVFVLGILFMTRTQFRKFQIHCRAAFSRFMTTT